MDKKICGAKTRSGKPCQRSPLKGKKRCRQHGGATPSGPDSVHYKHGRYAEAFKGELRKKFDLVQQDGEPLNLLPELHVQRALLTQYIDSLEGKTTSIKELKNVSILVEDVVKTAATIAKVRSEHALTVAEIRFVQAAMLNLLEKYVTDPNQRRNFVDEIRGLIPARLDTPV